MIKIISIGIKIKQMKRFHSWSDDLFSSRNYRDSSLDIESLDRVAYNDCTRNEVSMNTTIRRINSRKKTGNKSGNSKHPRMIARNFLNDARSILSIIIIVVDAASFHANVSIYIYRETNPSLYNIRAFVWISRLTFTIGIGIWKQIQILKFLWIID